MIYGRVIGNELRDVPPECLPIWGQRWSGHCAPHGPSPFSTRIFSVDQMSEMGQALTSPTQFEATLTEEDEGDTSPESSRLYSSFPSSSLAIQSDAAEFTPFMETPTPRFSHRSSSCHPHGSSETLHRSTRHPPPQNLTNFNTTFLLSQQSEQSDIQQHASELPSLPPPHHYGVSVRDNCGPLEDDDNHWGMNYTWSNIRPAGPSLGTHLRSGQLQSTILPHSTPGWQFANPRAQSSAYPFQPNPPSHRSSDYLLQPFQADDRARFIPTTMQASSHYFTLHLPQQNASSGNHDSSIIVVPGVAQSRNPMMSQWPSESVLPVPPFLGPLQNSGSSLGRGGPYHLVSDHHGNPPEGLLGTFVHAEDCTPLSPNEGGRLTS